MWTQLRPVIQWRTSDGESIVAGDMKITPQAQALVVQLPFAGLVWNRPAAVLVERDGRTERLAIVDVTRLALWGMWAVGVLFWLWRRRQVGQ